MIENSGKKQPLELYLHIPFCVRKCRYCDFLSGPATKEVQERYMDALVAELRGRSSECKEYQVNTIFIGGGTPSVVDAERIRQVMDIIRSCYDLNRDAEITLEMNPGTVDAGKLRTYREAGINRLSIGLQSVWNEELEALGRIHTYEQFLDAYEQAVEAGFTNINVDIMGALPGQTVTSWRETLRKLLSLEPLPAHISAYSLIVEEGTPLCSDVDNGVVSLPDEDGEREMYLMTEAILGEAGYRRYEISNYAMPGYECRHNCGYWKRSEYLGFGIGAASLMGECRFCNGDDLQKYIEDPMAARGELQELSVQERMEEYMFLGLRLTEGVSVAEFARIFGRDMESVYGEVICRNAKDDLLVLQGDRLRLTPRGTDVSNYVMSQFLF